MLHTDTVATGTAPGLRDIGIVPTSHEAIVPTYLWRFRKSGQFTAVTQ
jgi:NADH dehydrogenase